MRRNLSKLVLLSVGLCFGLGAGARVGDEAEGCNNSNDAFCDVALVSVIADANQFADQKVGLTGYLSRHNDEWRLYLMEDAALIGDVASSVHIHGSQGSVETDLKKMSEAYVRLIGVVHNSCVEGRLRTEVTVQRVVLLMRPDGRGAVRKILESQRNHKD